MISIESMLEPNYPHIAHKNHSQARGREKGLKNHLEARGSRRGTPNTPTGVKEKI
jgi:hypothetical protein